ncbi:MAG: DUF2508 family protein [Oscillospiraceae bacterium]|nr:DUF2508 family protein [Oscillospiraceae bacterium]
MKTANARKNARRLAESYRTELTDVKAKLERTKRELDEAYRTFNGATQPGLIDASIYQINALDARYSWLLAGAKEKALAIKTAEAAARRRKRAEERL